MASSHVEDDATVDVTVIGGGLAGLVTARRLAHAGLDVELLEERDHLGGCVGKLRLTGQGSSGPVDVTLDSGTESFSRASTPVMNLITELGLGRELTSPMPDGVWVAMARGAVRLPGTGFLGIPGSIPDAAHVGGWVGAVRGVVDHLLPARFGIGRPDRPMSLGRVVRSRLGRGLLNQGVSPVVGNIHLTHPDALDVDTVAPGLRAAIASTGSLTAAAAQLRSRTRTLSEVSSIDGGFNRLVDALTRDLIEAGGRIRTGVRVERAVPSATSPDWVLTTLGPAQPGTLEAAVGARTVQNLRTRHVVFAGDAASVEDVLGPVLPGLPRASSRGGVNIVTLLLEAEQLDVVPRGTSVLVSEEAARSTGACAKALTHVNAKWAWLNQTLPPHTHVVRVSYGHIGADPDVAEGRSETLARTALHDANLLLGVRLAPQNLLAHQVTRFPPGLPYLAVGHAERVARVRAAAARLPGLHLTGAWIAGTGVGPVVTDAQQVADQVLAAVRQHAAWQPTQLG